MKSRIAILLALLAACFAAKAQSQADSPTPFDSIKISIVNFYPGSDIYELEGHTVLRVQAPSQDVCFSWGTFDFNAPHFVWRFVKGETDYWMSEVDFPLMRNYYASEGRRIVEHEILMDSAQKARLGQLLAINSLPENRTYRYNYVKDNCALRPLRIVQEAMGDSIFLPAPTGTGAEARTFRQAMRAYHKNYPWYQFGIDLALGSGIDYPIDNWEQAFAPANLDSQLPSATFAGRPLAAPARVLFEGHDATLPPTPWYLTPMAVSILVFVLCLAFTVVDIRRRKVTRWLDAILFSAYGVAGLVLTFLIFISAHEATSPNWLYLWLNPLCLIVPIFIWLKKCKLVVLSYQFANFALLLALAVAWPLCSQSGNPAFALLAGADALRACNYIYVTIRNRK